MLLKQARIPSWQRRLVEEARRLCGSALQGNVRGGGVRTLALEALREDSRVALEACANVVPVSAYWRRRWRSMSNGHLYRIPFHLTLSLRVDSRNEDELEEHGRVTVNQPPLVQPGQLDFLS